MRDDRPTAPRDRPSDATEPPSVDTADGCGSAKQPEHASDSAAPSARCILIADEVDESREAMERALIRWGYRPRSAPSHSQAWRILQEPVPPQLVILSHAVPGANQVRLCERIRRLQQDYVYVISLAREGRNEDFAEAMAHGADACIRRPVDPEELLVRLRAGERILDLQAELLAAQDSLRDQATHDALTGLWNRPAILETLATEIDRARREDTSLAVLMVDLDDFKKINDTYGHAAGDMALRGTATRMRDVLRTYDMIGRYGGEEFLVVVPRCDLTFSAYVAERLRLAVAAEAIVTGETALYVTASFGIAAACGLEDPDGDTLIQAADNALYGAKRAGRNRVELATVAGGAT